MQLELLWLLQEKDLAIKGLQDDLQNTPLLGETCEMKENLQILQEEDRVAEERIKKEKKNLKKLELDVQKTSADRDALRRKLYGGEVGNMRELEQMEKKWNSLKREVDKLEDAAIESMENLEKMEQQLKERSENTLKQERLLQEKERELESVLGEIHKRIEDLQQQREKLEKMIEPQYLERYRILSQRHQGRGVARVMKDICEGCRVFISSKLRGLLYNPSAMVYCENCGRLLVMEYPPDDQEN